MRWFLLLPASLCAQNLTVLTESLPPAVLAQPYEAQLLASGGTRCTANHIWFRTSEGALPAGVTLDSAGWLRGTPRQPGASRFTIEARNDCGAVRRNYALLVAPARVLLLSPDRIELECPARSRCAAPHPLLVHASEASVSYQVVVDRAPWLAAFPERGETPSPSSALDADRLLLHVNTESLAPGRYEARLSITARSAANAPSAAVSLVVRPPASLEPPPSPPTRTMPQLPLSSPSPEPGTPKPSAAPTATEAAARKPPPSATPPVPPPSGPARPAPPAPAPQ